MLKIADLAMSFQSVVIILLLLVSLVAIAIYSSKLRRSLKAAPQLSKADIGAQEKQELPSISVIIPAYNEEANIEDCIKAVLQSSQLPAAQLEVWVVDDQSTDETLAIANSLQQQIEDPRLKILPGKPRPQNETWMGKNWACTQATQQAKGEFLLFIDADVRLKPGAIEIAIQKVQLEQIDLLSLIPALVCECFPEWIVQPLMVNNLAIGFDFAALNDPNTDTAFAAGPFMLFRRVSYEQIGGHRAVADQVVEDVELARKIKAAGLKLQMLLGAELISVRMYRSWGDLWEGWTKNLYLGAQRRVGTMLNFAFTMIVIYPLPWLCLAALLSKYFLGTPSALDYLSVTLALVAIASHYYLRKLGGKESLTPPRYWWLGGVGGAIIAAMAIASIIKTETGWGWTWRGRSLSTSS